MIRKKPTIEELEAILDGPEGMIEIQPDGTIVWIKDDPNHAKPKIYTMREVLGDSY